MKLLNCQVFYRREMMFLPPETREECERIIPEVDNVKPRDAADTYLFLKVHYPVQH